MKKKSYLKTGLKEINNFIDVNTGELIDSEVKHHKYMVDKDDFLLVYSSLLGVFNKMEQSEIRVFSYLLQYANGTKFSIGKSLRIEISKITKLNERTIYNTVKVLENKKLIFKLESGAYLVNPRFAFQGSKIDRNRSLKAIIELGCKDC